MLHIKTGIIAFVGAEIPCRNSSLCLPMMQDLGRPYTTTGVIVRLK